MVLENARRKTGEVRQAATDRVEARKEDLHELFDDRLPSAPAVLSVAEKAKRPMYGEERSAAATAAEIRDAVRVLPVQLHGKPSTGHAVVTTEPTKILKANPLRLSFTLVNIGARDAYIGFNESVCTPAQGNSGHCIPAGGAFDEDKYAGEIWGVTAVGSTTITFWEV